MDARLVFIVATIVFSFHLIHAIIPDCVVSQDGKGKFRTVSEAIEASPSHSATRYTILIKAGVYKEYILIGPEKINLLLIGDGISKTVISGNRSIGAGGSHLHDIATVSIQATRFMARDMTFENTAVMNQAVALESQADYLAFFRCGFKGYQDTLYISQGVQFFRECEVYGTVDFIFGDATVIFQNCMIYARRPKYGQFNTITAQSRLSSTSTTGIVIMNSTISGTEDLRQQIPRAKTYFGRPWEVFSRTVIMNCFVDDIIDSKGWLEWPDTRKYYVYYAEYQNTGPGANTTGRVEWSKVINTAEASTFTVTNFIQGGRWIPQDIPYFPDFP